MYLIAAWFVQPGVVSCHVPSQMDTVSYHTGRNQQVWSLTRLENSAFCLTGEGL